MPEIFMKNCASLNFEKVDSIQICVQDRKMEKKCTHACKNYLGLGIWTIRIFEKKKNICIYYLLLFSVILGFILLSYRKTYFQSNGFLASLNYNTTNIFLKTFLCNIQEATLV